jgi:predicted nucleic acid-binding protein
MDELRAGSRVYIDTNIWIYYIEAHPAFVKKVRDLFVRVEAAGAILVTNEITVAECLYKPASDGHSAAIDAYDRLFTSGEIELTALNGALVRQAAECGGNLGLKLIDAVHYVSALSNGCSYFVTSDTRFKSGPAMQVVRIQS